MADTHEQWKAADKRHPAQYSPEVIEAITPILAEWNAPVLDPFAGTGVRLGWLCDQLGLPYMGIEIEPEFIVDPRVVNGDATDGFTASEWTVIVTSPVYPNGIADHFKASDTKGRHTYRAALADIAGEDRELHPNNMGR